MPGGGAGKINPLCKRCGRRCRQHRQVVMVACPSFSPRRDDDPALWRQLPLLEALTRNGKGG